MSEPKKPWTTRELKLLFEWAGHKPKREIAYELKRSPGAVQMQAKRYGISLRYWHSTLVWCDQCATYRTELDELGRCPICRERTTYAATQSTIGAWLTMLEEHERDMYADNEALVESQRETTAPRTTIHPGMSIYERARAEDRLAREREAAELKFWVRANAAARQRLKRIRDKAQAKSAGPRR